MKYLRCFHNSKNAAQALGSRDDAGVSLFELLVTVLIFSLLLSAVTFSYQSWVNASQEAVQRTMAMQEGRLALANLSRDVRSAQPVRSSAVAQSIAQRRGGYPNCSTPPGPLPRRLDWASAFELSFYQSNNVSTQTPTLVRVRYTLDAEGRLRRAEKQFLPNERPEVTVTVASFVRNPRTGPNALPVFRYFRFADDPSSEMTPTFGSNPNYALGTGGCNTVWQLDEAQLITVQLLMDVNPETFVGRSILQTQIYVRSKGFWE